MILEFEMCNNIGATLEVSNRIWIWALFISEEASHLLDTLNVTTDHGRKAVQCLGVTN